MRCVSAVNPTIRVLHSSTFLLNVSTFCGIKGIQGGIQVVFRACLGVVRGYYGVSGGVLGALCVRNGSQVELRSGRAVRPCPRCPTGICTCGAGSRLWGRKSNLKANFERGPSYFSFKRSRPGAFNVGLKGSTCAALPGQRGRRVVGVRVG